MKTFVITLLGSVLTIPAWAGQFNVESIKQEDINWRFQRVHISADADATVVSGRLTAIRRFGLPRGHIDIAAYAPTGELLAESTSSYTPGILTRRMQRRGGLRFTATLDKKLPPGSLVKLAFHREPFLAPEPPKHRVNIAR